MCVGPRDPLAPSLYWGCRTLYLLFLPVNLSMVSFPSSLTRVLRSALRGKREGGRKEERKEKKKEGEKEFLNFISRPGHCLDFRSLVRPEAQSFFLREKSGGRKGRSFRALCPHPVENEGLAGAVQSSFSLIINSRYAFHEIKLPYKANFYIVLGALHLLTHICTKSSQKFRKAHLTLSSQPRIHCGHALTSNQNPYGAPLHISFPPPLPQATGGDSEVSLGQP